MSNYTMNCASCNDLKAVAPELLTFGITDTMEESLQNNTGLNPDLTVLHDNEEDLNDMIDCLIGRFAQQIEAYEDCDWKGFMRDFIGNLYGVFRASNASSSGLWTNVEYIMKNGGGGMQEDRMLTLPAEAIYAGYDIEDGYYTEVDASAVYLAGENAGKEAFASDVMPIYTGGLQPNQGLQQDTVVVTIDTDRPCLVIMWSSTWNSWGQWKRIGDQYVTYALNGQGNAFECTETSITITYRNTSYAPGRYIVYCLD